jgi:NAD(P)-dependent dehydrogenase (short-subunit alcohol dehydrogenase family)
MTSKLIAIIAGVGPGTGAALARKFALSYPVVLLARNPDNFNDLVKEINGNNGTAIGISTDVSSASSISSAFSEVEKHFGKGVGAAVSTFLSMSVVKRKQWSSDSLSKNGWQL